MLKISIITIGDELLIGQVVNTNVVKIASKLTELGAVVNLHATVGDSKEEIINTLNYCLLISDIVITTGGLGPTDDDITKKVITEFIDDELITSYTVKEHILKMLETKGRIVTESNLRQAEIPSKSILLHNEIGTAPGFMINKNNKKIIVLPGVPEEMKYILDNSIIKIIKNELQNTHNDIIKYKTIVTSGIFESKLAELIGPASDYPQNISLAYLPSAKGVRLRIGAVAENFEKADSLIDKFEKKITSKFKKHIIGYNNDSLAEIVVKQLIEKQLTVAVAESCTAGMLGTTITSISGSSACFKGGMIVYSNQMKIDLLDIDSQLLEKNGAVSEQTATQMSQNIIKKCNSDFGIAITGLAGPTGGTEQKPIGTVFISISNSENTYTNKYIFGNDREANRLKSVNQALLNLKQLL